MTGPSTTHVLRLLERVSPAVLGAKGRAGLLALAALSDRDLDSPQGLDAIRADRVAGVLGVSLDTATMTLRTLASAGFVAMVVDDLLRRTLTGDEAATYRLARRGALRGFRLPEEAYR